MPSNHVSHWKNKLINPSLKSSIFILVMAISGLGLVHASVELSVDEQGCSDGIDVSAIDSNHSTRSVPLNCATQKQKSNSMGEMEVIGSGEILLSPNGEWTLTVGDRSLWLEGSTGTKAVLFDTAGYTINKVIVNEKVTVIEGSLFISYPVVSPEVFFSDVKSDSDTRPVVPGNGAVEGDLKSHDETRWARGTVVGNGADSLFVESYIL